MSAAEVRALAEQGPTDKELSRAKAVMKAGLWMSDENPMSRAGRNAAQTLIFGAPRSSLSMTEQLEVRAWTTCGASVDDCWRQAPPPRPFWGPRAPHRRARPSPRLCSRHSQERSAPGSVMLTLNPGDRLMSVRVALIVGSLREGSYSRAVALELKALAAPISNWIWSKSATCRCTIPIWKRTRRPPPGPGSAKRWRPPRPCCSSRRNTIAPSPAP